ncbi:MAG: response regulator transcription factor, partial [Anaerolineales bacterium]
MQRIGGANASSRILVIDDDPDIAKLLTTMLKPQGFTVYYACDGEEGLKNAYELHPDLIVLDIMMPCVDGWHVCTRLRELTDVPILMLTARSAETDMLRGFLSGADDYMKKPFSKAELEARIRALLRRKTSHSGDTGSGISHYKDRLLNINLETQVVELEGRVLDLSATEYSLLACLVRNMGRTVTHSQLFREVWGSEYGDISGTLTLYIYYLRKKIEDSRHNHQYIHTQWGRGYCFMPLNEF